VKRKMAFRKDWKGISQTIASFISAFRSSPKISGTECSNHQIPVKVLPLATTHSSMIDLGFLGDLDRRRTSPYMTSIRNQIR
jgi:hypothetical protein